MRIKYQFSVLRFIYDPVTQEFINVGVVVSAPQSSFLKAICTLQYGRISRLFRPIDGPRLRQTLRYIQSEINARGAEIERGLLFSVESQLSEILSQVLPSDDSSLQFVRGGVGISDDLDKTSEALFDRYVNAYSLSYDVVKRDDDEVWRTFRKEFEHRHLLSRLQPKRIVGNDYQYEFQHAWKNGVWNIFEPMSFDLQDAGAMLEKASRWIGRTTSLIDSSESFKMFFLLGPPTDSRLTDAYQKAQNLLKKIPGRVEFIKESEADALADEVQSEMKVHSA